MAILARLRPICGSSRLGIYSLKRNVENPAINTNGIYGFERGNKIFELSNHLGNVLVTLSDKKIAVDGDGDGDIDYYEADVMTATDYYPGGMDMPGSTFSSGTPYRYGAANGQEKSTEINGSSYTAEFWQYDARIVRRWNVDPITKVYESPYAAFANNPIWFMDRNGADTTAPQGDWYRKQVGNNVTYKYAMGSDKKELDANSKTWWNIPEASRDRAVSFENSFAPTAVQTSFRLHADGTFTVSKSDL